MAIKIEILSIEEVDLPNYTETISCGDQSYEREAPLLAKFKVVVKSDPQLKELFFEIRKQDDLVSIDEYYEDQVYDEVQKLIPSTLSSKQRTKRSNEIMNFLSEEIFNYWSNEVQQFPIVFPKDIEQRA